MAAAKKQVQSPSRAVSVSVPSAAPFGSAPLLGAATDPNQKVVLLLGALKDSREAEVRVRQQLKQVQKAYDDLCRQRGINPVRSQCEYACFRAELADLEEQQQLVRPRLAHVWGASAAASPTTLPRSPLPHDADDDDTIAAALAAEAASARTTAAAAGAEARDLRELVRFQRVAAQALGTVYLRSLGLLRRRLKTAGAHVERLTKEAAAAQGAAGAQYGGAAAASPTASKGSMRRPATKSMHSEASTQTALAVKEGPEAPVNDAAAAEWARRSEERAAAAAAAARADVEGEVEARLQAEMASLRDGWLAANEAAVEEQRRAEAAHLEQHEQHVADIGRLHEQLEQARRECEARRAEASAAARAQQAAEGAQRAAAERLVASEGREAALRAQMHGQGSELEQANAKAHAQLSLLTHVRRMEESLRLEVRDARSVAGGAKTEAGSLRRVAAVMARLLHAARARLVELEGAFGGLAPMQARQLTLSKAADAEHANACKLLLSDELGDMLHAMVEQQHLERTGSGAHATAAQHGGGAPAASPFMAPHNGNSLASAADAAAARRQVAARTSTAAVPRARPSSAAARVQTAHVRAPPPPGMTAQQQPPSGTRPAPALHTSASSSHVPLPANAYQCGQPGQHKLQGNRAAPPWQPPPKPPQQQQQQPAHHAPLRPQPQPQPARPRPAAAGTAQPSRQLSQAASTPVLVADNAPVWEALGSSIGSASKARPRVLVRSAFSSPGLLDEADMLNVLGRSHHGAGSKSPPRANQSPPRSKTASPTCLTPSQHAHHRDHPPSAHAQRVPATATGSQPQLAVSTQA